MSKLENNEGWRGNEQELKGLNITEERFTFLGLWDKSKHN